MTADAKILLTGATGFIGGSILTALLQSSHSSIPSSPITCLLRDANRAALLTSTYGERVNPVVYNGLDDLETTTAVAAQHDLVINTTLGYHSASTALLRGLAQRKDQSRRDPITQPVALKEFDDLVDDVYAYEKALEAAEPYAQRTTELGVIDTGLELGVKTLVIMSPIIYGNGTGLFNKAMLEIGHAVVLGDESGVWDHVHIADLAELYRLVVLNILEQEGNALPTGKKGIIFSANGRYSWLEYSQLVADACYERGLLSERKVTSLTLKEAAETLLPRLGFASKAFDYEQLKLAAEGFCSNERTVANVARSIGWNPVKGRDAWEQSFRDDVDAIQS
ncbi:Putative NAD dependent epimerase/dehydratase family protein [Aspergillus calidoustus]|uniref:Putative NAD dependent epimerase/dehydratase family protein n=1 Tax=Aspergillus calidoustus TaxID=454130 RepID=A0A0U5CK52_ASPCI|nr:Putative NAD dependent epimerase/dehydratase family protein [Aspergillus calidoustus]